MWMTSTKWAITIRMSQVMCHRWKKSASAGLKKRRYLFGGRGYFVSTEEDYEGGVRDIWDRGFYSRIIAPSLKLLANEKE